MKKLYKDSLDNLINLTRRFWATGDDKDDKLIQKLINERFAQAKEIEAKCDADWCGLLYFLDGIFKYRGIAPDADNETIYAALKLFGWEVVEDGEVNLAG